MRKFMPIIIIWIAVLLAYFPTFSAYFSGDDFFMFKISLTNGSFGEFIKLLGIYPFEERGIAFYRPLFREILHNIYFNFFGLNHIPFRILLMGVHFINISLVYFLIQNIFKKRFLSFFVALFFGISSANVATLYYIPGGIESSGAVMFALLTIIFYKLKKYLLSLVIFLLALSSHEIILATPLILLALSSKKALIKLIPFFLLSAILLYIDTAKIGFSPGEVQYKFIFNPKIIGQSFIWYLSWGFGIPEMLQDFVLPGLNLNPNLIRYWGDFFKIIFPAFFVSFALLVTSTLYLLHKKSSVFLNKKFLFLLLWLMTGLLPIIFLPSHKSSHYLIFVLPALWGIIFYITNTLPKTLLFIFIISSLFLNIASIKLGEQTHWAATRGKTAQKLIKELRSTYLSLPKGAAIYFANDPAYPYLTKEWGGTSKQASFILNGADALQLLYKDPFLQVFYEDLGGIPKGFPPDKIYSLVAR
ncbi:hypothetical protein A3B42_02395 [Candidatus Daviesbacteria bacterium RIFCSPLOWO2_01_FULL_38_10]|nr:MAG: hypothetical protein A3B42_02395 [Candidatus Daviesbacteria bacterium RIFCSPLOWO2_01_FULL_38_10]OGE44605.1 MAG: hypothetical protein A3E67_02685 [Candidatus Daviesbacteria bacterium RIFCSPHIGHO2_12_FULL_38_25]OGE68849.1 MAG: hypothetical protein A3H81_04905 [Candidatus Daviesbacteria bacterium RIFCSPLOWO2_02_FULL_38_18]OGE73327.1 MAG: hypothetical protein A3H18_04685 [Candidatus Daviesbacteria bacterium RIFCSPLOWO2_12_FULL_38_10]HCB23048.1 hypothetical protein [Candidatus Daviesbacteria